MRPNFQSSSSLKIMHESQEDGHLIRTHAMKIFKESGHGGWKVTEFVMTCQELLNCIRIFRFYRESRGIQKERPTRYSSHFLCTGKQLIYKCVRWILTRKIVRHGTVILVSQQQNQKLIQYNQSTPYGDICHANSGCCIRHSLFNTLIPLSL